jgi:hypothetical protein
MSATLHIGPCGNVRYLTDVPTVLWHEVRMGKFVVVKAFAQASRQKYLWTIEEVTPGEKPVQLDFLGTAREAAEEARRLNLYGASRPPRNNCHCVEPGSASLASRSFAACS